MSWIFDHEQLGHRVFIAFIELKIEGNWIKSIIRSWDNPPRMINVLSAGNSNDAIIHIIEPDGLRRILHFTKGGTISMDQNIFSYHPDQAREIIVDEKEQAGKGKIRDKLF